ncbi:class I SAM-dependent methyltransferase [Luteimonas sp. A611]
MTDPHHWQHALTELPVERVPRCDLCGSTNASISDRWGGMLRLRSPFAVRHCRSCGLRWLDPRPDAEGYARLYSNEFYFGGEGASPENYAGLEALRERYFVERLRRIERAVGRFPLSILDYGAATGGFVALARKRGHACQGVELSGDARATARATHGIELVPGDAAADLAAGAFDALHMNHVLEHMPDPLQHLRWCRERLRPDGVLVIEVPQQFDNALDAARRALRIGGRRPMFDAYSLHHTYFFTHRTLSELCRKAGFTVAACRTFNPMSAPLWPPSLRNWVLHGFLRMADMVASAGNIVEIIAVPDRVDAR